MGQHAERPSDRRRPRDPPDDPGTPTADVHGETRSTATHRSTTDPEARLSRTGTGREATVCSRGHGVVENRHGLVVQAAATRATGTVEPETAVALVKRLAGGPATEWAAATESRHRTVGADTGDDTAAVVDAIRAVNVTPHVAQKAKGRAIDGQTTRQPGSAISQRARTRGDEIWGWVNTGGLMRKVRHRGTVRVDCMFVFACAVDNLVRMRPLAAVA